MKKYVIATCLLGMGVTMQAQDSYFNEQLTNASGDVYGTARFVGMGGAMGALGADISTMNWNPAGTGLIRRNDFSITAGAAWNLKGIDEKSTTNATLDQLGILYNADFDEPDGLRYINIGFNYQKKKDYNNGFYADNMNLNGLSQMTQLANITNRGYATENNLAGLAAGHGFLTAYDKDGNVATDKTAIDHYGNNYAGQSGFYTQYSSGSLQEFNLNISGNVSDRVYWGLTFGIDNLRYRGWNDYFEKSANEKTGAKGDCSVYNDLHIDGSGFNIMAGVIVRPIEDNPLRFGVAVESPTWLQLKRSNLYSMTDNVSAYMTDEYESYLEYSIRTPFKVRASVGSTVSNFLAWDVDYEFSNYRNLAQGYPETDLEDPNGSLFDNTWDREMNRNTDNYMKPVHNVRAGLEVKPLPWLACRIGYNYASSAYEDRIKLDQQNIDSYSMNYATNTGYMRLGDVNTLTLGLGVKGQSCYFDLVYKLKNQKGDYYAFDATSQGSSLKPVNADLTRHQITATLGFKF